MDLTYIQKDKANLNKSHLRRENRTGYHQPMRKMHESEHNIKDE